jgi:hypothetical protein
VQLAAAEADFDSEALVVDVDALFTLAALRLRPELMINGEDGTRTRSLAREAVAKLGLTKEEELTTLGADADEMTLGDTR